MEAQSKRQESPKPEVVDLEADPILDEEITALQDKIKRLTIENQTVREKIENTNSGISSYISEMSSLLDSQDMQTMFGNI